MELLERYQAARGTSVFQRPPSLRQPIVARVALLLLIMILATGARAANFYVRAGATGAKTGADWSNAWTDFSQMNWSSINPGDTIYMAAGTYTSLAVIKSGAASAPITFKRATASAHGTDTGWSVNFDGRVIIDGERSLAAIGIGEGGNYTGQSYITVDGATRYGIWLRNAYYGVRADRGNSNNLTFRFIEMGDSGSYYLDEDGIQGAGNNLLVENCYIHDTDSTVTHGDGVQWFNGTNVVIRYNVFRNTGQLFMLSETAWGNDHVNELWIYYNVFYNRGGAHYNGISKKLCPQSGYTWHIYNNTFDLEAKDNSGYNNIFSGAGSCSQMDFKNNAVIYSNAGSVGGVTHSYNAYDNAGASAVYNIPTETGRVAAADLGFVNVAAADYHLLSSSPLIGKGISVGLARDFDGNPVPATPSIGAFEFATDIETPPLPPATATPAPSPMPVPANPTPVPATPPPVPPSAITGESLFGNASPAILDANDGVAYELGMKFSSTTAGQITAIRFYKSSSETSTHTGKIYSPTGALLASVAFTNETASGWQEQALATPLAIAANTTYTVSVNTAAGYYVATNKDFATQKSNVNLRSSATSAGVYGAVGSIPTKSWQSSNYFRDVVFVATSITTPTPIDAPVPSTSDGSAPSTSIASPTNGSSVARRSTVTISASASDNIAVTKVEFYVNGVLKYTDTAAPYRCTWAVPRGRNIPYSLQTKAYDAAGNVDTSALVKVTSK